MLRMRIRIRQCSAFHPHGSLKCAAAVQQVLRPWHRRPLCTCAAAQGPQDPQTARERPVSTGPNTRREPSTTTGEKGRTVTWRRYVAQEGTVPEGQQTTSEQEPQQGRAIAWRRYVAQEGTRPEQAASEQEPQQQQQQQQQRWQKQRQPYEQQRQLADQQERRQQGAQQHEQQQQNAGQQPRQQRQLQLRGQLARRPGVSRHRLFGGELNSNGGAAAKQQQRRRDGRGFATRWAPSEQEDSEQLSDGSHPEEEEEDNQQQQQPQPQLMGQTQQKQQQHEKRQQQTRQQQQQQDNGGEGEDEDEGEDAEGEEDEEKEAERLRRARQELEATWWWLEDEKDDPTERLWRKYTRGLTVKEWPAGQSPRTHLLHVYWDLDNKTPEEWSDTATIVSSLQDLLWKGGQVVAMRAWANVTTLQRHQLEMEDLEQLVEQVDKKEAFKCPLCARKLRNQVELEKHFKQLHEKEHRKRSGSGGKNAQKYVQSKKAAKYEAAATALGMTSERLGIRGRTLKQLLEQLGVQLRDVPNEDQAADMRLTQTALKLVHSRPGQVMAWGPPHGCPYDLLGHLLLKKASGLGATLPKSLRDIDEMVQQQQKTKPAQPMTNVLVLVSGDGGFKSLLAKAKEKGWGTAVVCQVNEVAKFDGVADAWLDWGRVEAQFLGF